MRAEKELESKAPLPPLGNDPGSLQWRETTMETSKQTVTTHLATMNAATAQVVTASQPDEVDHEAVGAAVSQIAQSIPEVTKEVRLIAALMEDNGSGDKLLEATRKLCNAMSDLLRAAEPENKEPRQNLLNAASRVGEASGQVLSTIGEESVEGKELHDMLLGLAKAVANTTAALVLKAKSVAADCDDESTRNKGNILRVDIHLAGQYRSVPHCPLFVYRKKVRITQLLNKPCHQIKKQRVTICAMPKYKRFFLKI